MSQQYHRFTYNHGRGVTIDGYPVTVRGLPTVSPITDSLTIVQINVPCRKVIYSPDGSFGSSEATPIYDQLLAEARVRQAAARIREANARTTAQRLRNARKENA